MLGGILANAEGELPEYYIFIVPKSDYKVLDTWHVAGLRGTGSKSIVLKDVMVRASHSVSIHNLKHGTAPGAKTMRPPLRPFTLTCTELLPERAERFLL